MTTQAPNRTAARPTSLNPARRFSVRLVLATGATLATLLGSQTLSILETPTPAATTGAEPPLPQTAITHLAGDAAVVPVLAVQSNSGVKPPAAPILVIVRNPNGTSSVIAAQKDSASAVSQSAVVQAPQPVFNSPSPVIVSPSFAQPMPFTRSSR